MKQVELYEQTSFDFGFQEEQQDTKYVKKAGIPQYEPTGKNVPIYLLVDKQKTKRLIERINNSKVSDEEKEFLKFAAMRHLRFNYSQIAEYYANASKEMQELMEQSALVIIDIKDAIANAYVKLSKNIEEIMKKSGRLATTSKGDDLSEK